MDNNMKFKLSVDISDLKKGLEDAKKGFKDLQEQAKKLGESDSANKMADSILKLGDTFKGAGGDLSGFVSQFGKYGKVAAVAIKATEMVIKAIIKFGKEVIKTGKQVVKAFDTIIKAAAKLGKAVAKSLEATVKVMGKAAKAAGSFALALGGTASVAIGGFAKQASDLNESINAVQVVFGEAGDSMVAWAKTAGASFGISQQAVMDFSAQLGGYTKALGLTSQEQEMMSKSLIGLTGDVASLRNMTHDEVWGKFMSGLSGETEAIKTLGVDLKVAAMEAFMLANGVNASWKEMSESEKVMWRYKKIMNDLAFANGDFLKTLKSLPNQIRFLKMAFSDLAISVGGVFLPIIEDALFGLTESMYDNIQEISKMLMSGDVKGALKKFGKTMTEGITEVARKLTPVFNEFGTLTAGLIDGIADGMSQGAINLRIGLGNMINSISDAMPDIKKAGENLATVIQEIFRSKLLSNLVEIGGGLALALLKGFSDNIIILNEYMLKELINIVESVKNILPTALSIGMDIAQSILTGLTIGTTPYIDVIMGKINEMFAYIHGFVLAQAPQLVKDGFEIVVSIARGISEAVPTLVSTAGILISSFARGIIESAPQIIATGFDIIRGLVEGISKNLPIVLEAAQSVIDSFLNGLKNNKDIIDTAYQVVRDLVIFLGDNAPQLAEAASQLMSQLAEAFRNDSQLQDAAGNIVEALARITVEKKMLLFESGMSLGWEFVKGLWKGMWDAGANRKPINDNNFVPTAEEATQAGLEYGEAWISSSGKVFDEKGPSLTDSLFSGDTYTQIQVSGAEAGYAYINGIKTKISETSPEIQAVINELLAEQGEAGTRGQETGQSYVNGTKQGIAEGKEGVKSEARNVGTESTAAMLEELSNLSPETYRKMLDAAQSVRQSATDMYNGAKYSFSQLGIAAKEAMTDMYKGVGTSMYMLAIKVKQEATNMYNGAKTSFTKLAQEGKQALSDLYNGGSNSVRQLSYSVQGCMNSVRSAINIKNAVNTAISDFQRLASALSKPINAKVNIAKTTTVSTVSAPQAQAFTRGASYSSGNSTHKEEDNRIFKFEIPVLMDGREVARATAQYVNGEIRTMDNRKARLLGGV